MLFLWDMLEVSIGEESLINLEDDVVDIFSVASTFMRWKLQQTDGYFKDPLPGYSLDEFKSHFRMTRGTMKGGVPQWHSFGRPPILLHKQGRALVKL